MAAAIPTMQSAIELVGPDQLRLTADKSVELPDSYQILARIEAVGICFSDLKLLKQFDKHPRKSEIREAAYTDVLATLPSYCPGNAATVPGHEVVATIVAVGDKVQRHSVGQRVLVQTDYRWLKTATSNAAFGYNLEGGMQQYVLMDERVIIDPQTAESFLIPVDDEHGASAIALVEPWACVECSYITGQRKGLLSGGRLLVVVEADRKPEHIAECVAAGKPGTITAVCADATQTQKLEKLNASIRSVENLSELPDESFDDIIYFGSNKVSLDVLSGKLAVDGIINIVLAGEQIGEPVSVDVGRIHYQGTRWIGTTGRNPLNSYAMIPADGEIRDGDRILVMGAAGPMGQMHVIRLACSGKHDIVVLGTDLDENRLKALDKKVQPMAQANNVQVELFDPRNRPLDGIFRYIAIMVPIGQMVAQAVEQSEDGAIINIFAGIPAGVKQDLDLDTIIARRCYLFGTSGSRLDDMKICLQKVVSGKLDTNSSVDAVSGLAGAIDGIRAVENRTMSGKIIVYPALPDLPLLRLDELAGRFPTVSEKLHHGMWTRQAEEELLRAAQPASAE